MKTTTLSRRQFMHMAAGTGATLALAACAPAAQSPGQSGPDEAAVEVTFEMYNFDPWLIALGEMFTEFAEQNPGITATVQSAPWDEFWPRQEARLAAGNPSDMSIGDPSFFGRYAHRGFYAEMAPFIERDGVNLDNWFDVTIADCRYDSTTGVVGSGELYGMPATYVGIVTYFNKDLLDAAGVEYPDDSWTRDDLMAAAQALTFDRSGNPATSPDFDSGDVQQWGVYTLGATALAQLIWNNGGELISLDQTTCMMSEPESVEIFEWLSSLLHEYSAHPTPAQLEGLPNPFIMGRVAITLDGTWNIDHYVDTLEFDWDIAPVPLGTAGQDRVTYAGTNTLHIFRDSANLDEAWTLMQYLTGMGGMAYFARTGTPALIESANSDAYLTGSPDNRPVAVEVGEYARNYYPGLKSDLWKQIFNAEIQAVWLNEGSPQEVLDGICGRITPILETPVDEI